MSNKPQEPETVEDNINDILQDLIYDTPNSYGYPPDFEPDFEKAVAQLNQLLIKERQKLEKELRFYRHLEVEKMGLSPHKVKAEQLWREYSNLENQLGEKS